MTMGQRINWGRKALGLSQEALAEAVGVTRQAVSKWELDEAQPDAAKVILLAQTLGMTTDQLLLGEAAAPAPQPATSQPTVPPQRDHLGALARLLKKHGYKAGYLLIAYGLILMLFAGMGSLAFHSFFAGVAQDMAPDVSWEQDLQEIELHLAPGVTLSPEEREIILDAMREETGSGASIPSQTDFGIPRGIQTTFYIILAIPAILGAALVVTGVVIVVKYKGKQDQ